MNKNSNRVMTIHCARRNIRCIVYAHEFGRKFIAALYLDCRGWVGVYELAKTRSKFSNHYWIMQ